MDLARARFLVSPAGREALASLSPDLEGMSPLAVASALRRAYPTAEAAALGEQIALRARARARLGDDAPAWLLSGDGLEMLAHPIAARRRAARLVRLGLPVVDLTCGLGGDLRPVAEAGLTAIGVDRDGPSALLARANVPAAAVLMGDAEAPPVRVDGSAVIIDPSRRSGGRRTFDPAAFSPPWTVALAVAAGARAGILKAPPGIDHAALPGDAEVEFVQAGRSLVECVAWIGEGASPGVRRAVLLPQGATLESTDPASPEGVGSPGPLLLDPRPCVTRSGLVRQLAWRAGARMLDPSVAYLAADGPVADPLCDAFAVLDVVPFSLQRLRRRLREAGWAPHEIRRRAFPIEPDDLRARLGRLEGDPVTLLCTTILGRRLVFVGLRA